MGWSLTHVWWIKIQEGYHGNEEPQSHTRPPSPGIQCQEDKSPQLLAAKTSGASVSGRNFWSPEQFLLKNPHTDSPTQTHSSGLWHWDGSLRGTSGMQGEAEVSGIKASRGHCSFSESFPHRDCRLVLYVGFHNLANSV